MSILQTSNRFAFGPCSFLATFAVPGMFFLLYNGPSIQPESGCYNNIHATIVPMNTTCSASHLCSSELSCLGKMFDVYVHLLKQVLLYCPQKHPVSASQTAENTGAWSLTLVSLQYTSLRRWGEKLTIKKNYEQGMETCESVMST